MSSCLRDADWSARLERNPASGCAAPVVFSRADAMLGCIAIDGKIESTSMTHPSDKDLERAEGSGRIVVSGSEKGTCITDVFQRSPIRIMFPRVGGAPVEEAVLINTAGGVAGGDWLESTVTALGNASIAGTSQAAEKVYPALNAPAPLATKRKAHARARRPRVPHETNVC